MKIKNPVLITSMRSILYKNEVKKKDIAELQKKFNILYEQERKRKGIAEYEKKNKQMD